MHSDSFSEEFVKWLEETSPIVYQKLKAKFLAEREKKVIYGKAVSLTEVMRRLKEPPRK